jgi:hypothetical protein
MAVEEKVVIKVEIDADITNDLAAIERRIRNLDATTKKFNNTNRDLDKTTNKLTRRFGGMTRAVTGFMKVFTKFITMMGKFSFLALAGHIAIVTAGLLAAKAALITGRAAVKLYDVALKGLTVTAAGLATTLAVAAAAMREFNEAQLAPILGGGNLGMNRARTFTQGISSRNLGLLGGEASASVINSLARSGIQGARANQLVTNLFNIAGGDAKAVTTLAAAIGSRNFGDARTAVQGAQGFKKGSLGGVTTMAGLTGVISAGGATKAGFQGLSQNMGGTLIGTAKTEFAGQKGLFADLGEPLLGPFRDTFLQISNIIKNDIISMASIIQKFGEGSFAPTLVTTVRAISGWVRENVLEDIDRIEEMGKSFVGFFVGVRDFFDSMGAWFNKFEPAANLLLDMFRAMGSAAGGRGLFAEFRQLMMSNADNFIAFGESLGNVIGSLFDRLSNGQTGFFDKLPLINEVLDKLAFEVIPAMFNLFNTIFPILEQLPEALHSLASVLNFLAPIVSTLVTSIASLASMVNSIGGGNTFGTAIMAGAMYMGGRKLGVFGRAARTARNASGMGRVAFAGSNIAAGARSLSGSRAIASRQLSSGYQAFRHGQGVRGAFQASKLAGVRAGAMTGARFMPLANVALSGYMAYNSLNQAAQTGQMTGSTALSGGLAGMSIGGMVGGPLGAAVGAAIGAIAGGVGEWFASRKGQERLRKEADKQSTRIFNEASGFKVGSGTEAYMKQAGMLEGFSAAFFADKARDEYGRLKVNDKGNFEGDTAEFGKFLLSMGVDPDSVHRDNLFTSLVNKGLLSELENSVMAAEDLYVRQINRVVEATGIAAENIEGVMDMLNIDGYKDLNETAIGVLSTLFTMGDIDRTKSFIGNIDLSTSPIGQRTRSASVDAALNAFISGGSMDEQLLMDIFNAIGIAEVAMGGSADLAGVSGITFIKKAQEAGAFGGVDVVGQFGLNAALATQYQLLSDESGIPVSQFEGKTTFEINNMLNQANRDRAMYRDVFTGKKGIGDFSAGQIAGLDTAGFARYVMNQDDEYGFRSNDMIGNLVGGPLFEKLMSGDLGALEEFYGKEESSQLLINYLTETGQYAASDSAFLETIARNTGMRHQVIINAETVDERGVETVMLEIHNEVVEHTE